MNKFVLAAICMALISMFSHGVSYAQKRDSLQQDSVQRWSSITGTIGLTNNGFSIVPTFSLNSPAFIINLYYRKKRFSFDPDIRLVPDLRKGGMLFWLRYHAVERKRFNFRLGIHPAFSLVRRTVTENGKTTEITEALRFLAGEIAPELKITPRWSLGMIYLHGSALQNHGPQRTDVVFLHSAIADIPISKQLLLTLLPMIFYLDTDGYTGTYFSGTVKVNHRKWPFSLQGTINQTFKSDVPGNQNFMWNMTLNYHFNKRNCSQ